MKLNEFTKNGVKLMTSSKICDHCGNFIRHDDVYVVKKDLYYHYGCFESVKNV